MFPIQDSVSSRAVPVVTEGREQIPRPPARRTPCVHSVFYGLKILPAKTRAWTEATLHFSARRGVPSFITTGSIGILRFVIFWPICNDFQLGQTLTCITSQCAKQPLQTIIPIAFRICLLSDSKSDVCRRKPGSDLNPGFGYAGA